MKISIILLIALLLIPGVLSVCTVTFDDTSYYPLETVTATMICSDNTEKSQPYTLNWSLNGLTNLEFDTGTTPSVVNIPFFQTYILNSTYAGTINATMNGTNLEGTDGANVTGSSVKVLSITDAKFSRNAYVGELFAVDFKVTDYLGNPISNAHCMTYGTDNNDAPLQTCGESHTHDGRGTCDGILFPLFVEGNNYLAKIKCDCQSGDDSCFDQNGNTVNYSTGSTSFPFTVSKWLYSNTLVDQTNYIEKEEIVICANLTNVNYSSRIGVEIYHQVRCSAWNDNNNDLDRVLIISDDDNPDRRGISTNTTQMQCKRFVVPEPRYLQGKTSQCYASTEVWVLNNENQKIYKYLTTSPVFNITLNDLQIQPDWERVNNYQWKSTVNLSDSAYYDWNGTGISNIDLRLDKVLTYIRSYEQDVLPEIDFNTLLLSNYIKNWTVSYCNSTPINSGLEINEDGNLEIELRNVGISQDIINCYNVTLNLNSFEERSAEALEGIENKTGTFKLSLECPDIGKLGEYISCNILAQVEDSNQLEKEVDFTCYIKDDLGKYSELNFNQMINRNLTTINKNFLIPTTFQINKYKQVFCEASYYNLGLRTDTFYDTFRVDSRSKNSIFYDSIENNLIFIYLVLFILFLCLVYMFFKIKKN